MEADNNYRRELGIGVEETVEYENPETVSMQNNFINSEGLYEWYVIRESKSITLRNRTSKSYFSETHLTNKRRMYSPRDRERQRLRKAIQSDWKSVWGESRVLQVFVE